MYISVCLPHFLKRWIVDNFVQLYMSGKPTFSLFPFIKNDFGSPEAEQVGLPVIERQLATKEFICCVRCHNNRVQKASFIFTFPVFPGRHQSWTVLSWRQMDKGVTNWKKCVEQQWIPCDILADLVLVDIFNRLMLVTSQVCCPARFSSRLSEKYGNCKVLWHRYQVEVGIGRHGVNFTVGFTILFGMETFDGAVAIDKVGWWNILFC